MSIAVEETQDIEPTAGEVAGSTVIVMAGFAASIVTGLIRQRIVAGIFGTGADLDAYFAANGIPELLFNALAGGALTFAFIPIYSKVLESKDQAASNRLFSLVTNVIFIVVALASILVALIAPWLVTGPVGVGKGFTPEIQVVSIGLMRILLLSTLIFAASNMITGALWAHRHFLLPALTPIVYGVGIILGALFLAPSIGVYGLAWGAVLGALLHLGIQIPAMFKFGIRWRAIATFTDPSLRRVAILMAPRVIDLFMARAIIDWLNRSIASGLREGSVSALGYGYTLMNMPWTLIGTAIGIAVFPTMARLAAQEDVAKQREALSGSLRAILTLVLPAAVGLIVLGVPIIQVLYEGGEFTAESTRLVYYGLQFYTLTLISQSVLEVVVRSFAAQEDTWTPLFVSFFTTALNVGLAYWLVRPLLHGGLPLANGIAVGVESLIGLFILSRRWKGIEAPNILSHTVRAAAAALLMGGAVYLVLQQFDLVGLRALLVGGVVGAGVYVASALLLGIREVVTIPWSVLQRYIPRFGNEPVTPT